MFDSPSWYLPSLAIPIQSFQSSSSVFSSLQYKRPFLKLLPSGPSSRHPPQPLYGSLIPISRFGIACASPLVRWGLDALRTCTEIRPFSLHKLRLSRKAFLPASVRFYSIHPLKPPSTCHLVSAPGLRIGISSFPFYLVTDLESLSKHLALVTCPSLFASPSNDGFGEWTDVRKPRSIGENRRR